VLAVANSLGEHGRLLGRGCAGVVKFALHLAEAHRRVVKKALYLDGL
jgi:hypothetical protein